jgi:aminoglycoside 2'-N-acetyltransferase I
VTSLALEIIAAPGAESPLGNHLREWFEEEFGRADRWASPDHYAICRVENRMAGRLGILDRQVTVGATVVRVGGIGGVATRPEFRHRGIASAMLTRAAEFMRDNLGLEFGLLLCRPEVSPVYAKSGWVRADGPTTFVRAGVTATYPDFTMILSLTGKRWPQGPIDMIGLPW